MLKHTLALALLTALLAACTPNPATPPPAGMADMLPSRDYPQIVATSGLQPFLAFDRPNVQVAPDRPMSVVTGVRNLDPLAVRVQYRYLFFDRTGRPISPTMDFQYVRLPGSGVQTFLEGKALDTNAVEWRLEVRTGI